MNSILTVSAVNTYVAFKLKNDPKLKGIAVRGEISDLSLNYSSGHMYFTLTDGNASIKAVMFSSNASKLRFFPQIGDSVIAFGGIDVYERSGVYQINCTQLVPEGVGSDVKRLADLKSELDKLGVFSKPKRPIAKYPKMIAVVTSPTGAAIEDIKSVALRRYPAVKINLFPATVQGLTAPKSIADALASADKSGADTIILTRGGGSNDDLSCFNTKEAVLGVFNCKTPVVSAVGHEIDITLCDLAADLRAPTPSAAAELSTPDICEIAKEIEYLRDGMKRDFARKLDTYESRVVSNLNVISAYSPQNKLNRLCSEVKTYREMTAKLAQARLKGFESGVRGYINTLSAFDPMSVVKRGYTLVYKDGKPVTGSNILDIGDKIQVVFKDGSVTAEVESKNE